MQNETILICNNMIHCIVMIHRKMMGMVTFAPVAQRNGNLVKKVPFHCSTQRHFYLKFLCILKNDLILSIHDYSCHIFKTDSLLKYYFLKTPLPNFFVQNFLTYSHKSDFFKTFHLTQPLFFSLSTIEEYTNETLLNTINLHKVWHKTLFYTFM